VRALLVAGGARAESGVEPGAEVNPVAGDDDAPSWPAPRGWRERWAAWTSRFADRVEPSRGTLTAVAVAVVVTAVLAGLWLYLARPRSQALAVSPAATASASGSPAASASSSTSAAAAPVVVDVVGKVAHPGLISLPAGSRIADALVAAGGPLAGVDTSGLNLARKLTDGEQIAVGVVGATDSAPSAASGSGASAGPVDLNTATLAQLDALPGVGPVLAQHILDWRTAHGRFTSVDQLREVSGIGTAKFADLRPLVKV